MNTKIDFKAKPILMIVLAIVLVALLGWWAYSIYVPSPSNTVKSYFEHISNEQYSEAYDLLDGSYKKMKVDLDTFTAAFDNARQHGTIYKSVIINNVSDSNRKSQKVVAFTLVTREKGRETSPQGQYVLTKIDGKWKITDSLN
ncbi:MAG: hypothetical protein KAH01_03275 [Caldisericia bacterium]|nr:hypothetical protein [Caldisericia bacterium]